MHIFGLVGNPNCGKTALFNRLTGSTAHVGNWAGVTVDRKEGVYHYIEGKEANIVDLPGIYSLSPYTPEEIIARNYIVQDTPELIINVIDATNLERNLYLTTQILEMDCPVVIALNMMDLVEKAGDTIDIAGLSTLLGVPIVPISVLKGEGINQLMETAMDTAKKPRQGKSVLVQSKIGKAITEMEQILCQYHQKHVVFHAVKMLESDPLTMENPQLSEHKEKVKGILHQMEKGDKYHDVEAIVADLRYTFITEHCAPLVTKKRKNGDTNFSNQWDRLLTNRYLGIPIFLIFMFFVFHITFSETLFGMEGVKAPGVWLKGLAESGVGGLSHGVSILLAKAGASHWIHGLIVEGAMGGVGAVLSFVPQILCLFFFLSILEDSGYMARAAFLMDRLLRHFGLSGRAFLPLLMGFGCSVPAILSTRTLERERDRKITILMIPFFSCGAKLPMYAIFAAALFPKNGDKMVFMMYLIGILVAAVSAIILNKLVFRGETAPFLMELPAYHIPQLRSLTLLLWEKLKSYVVRAGTLILASTIFIWFLSNVSFHLELVESPSDSMLGVIGTALVPFFRPLGFVSGNDGWKAIVAIMAGFIAKEAVVSTLGVLYPSSVGGDIWGSEEAKDAFLLTIAATFTPMAAISFMTFHLLCTPCVAAVSAVRAEMDSWKWTLFAICFWMGTAWIVSFLIFQGGTLLRLFI